jgi:hypothetical protein
MGCLLVTAGLAGTAAAQTPAPLTAEDRSAIQALVTNYARALGACSAEEFADLFAPGTGSFASGFRGHVVGRARLIALVQSERHCIAPASGTQAPRPGGSAGPTVAIQETPTGVRGIADLGAAGQYQDEYVKTASGWRFASRAVLTPAEAAAGLDAREMLAIRQLTPAAELTDNYAPDQNGVKRFRASGVALTVKGSEITGRAYLKAGGYYDDVYEKTAPGQWRIKSRVHVPSAPETAER